MLSVKMPPGARARRRLGTALLAVAGNALAVGGCGFIPRSTIPQPFVRPGAPVFYLKVERYSLSETTTYKGTGVETVVHSTRYIAVDLATCRKLGELKVDGKTAEEAWDPSGDELWFSPGIGYGSRQARSFHGREVALPKIARPGAPRWTTAGALRFVYPDDGAEPAVWSFHTGRSTPVPPPAAVGAPAGASEHIRAEVYGAGRLIGIEAPAPAGTVDIIVVEPPIDPNAPPVVVRRTLMVGDQNERALGVARDGQTILFADQQRALEPLRLGGRPPAVAKHAAASNPDRRPALAGPPLPGTARQRRGPPVPTYRRNAR